MIFNEILVTMMSSDPKFFINCFFFSFLQGKVIGLYQSLFFFFNIHRLPPFPKIFKTLIRLYRLSKTVVAVHIPQQLWPRDTNQVNHISVKVNMEFRTKIPMCPAWFSSKNSFRCWLPCSATLYRHWLRSSVCKVLW